MIYTANRASALLYRFLRTFPQSGTYILPANVCPVVPFTFIKAGVAFEFADINSDTLCIDEGSVIELVSKRKKYYSGLLFVRTYGYQYNTTDFFRELKSLDNSFQIIDDKCLCYPDYELVAPFTDMELYSTGYAKVVDIGYGGYAKVPEDLKLKSVHEAYSKKSYELLEEEFKSCLAGKNIINTGINDWLDTSEPEYTNEEYFNNIQSRIGSVKSHKLLLNSIYKEELKNVATLKDEFQNWRYNVITENKDFILEQIFKAGLFASSHYSPSSILFEKKYYPVAENLSRKVINLFSDFRFSVSQAKAICGVINKNL
jgi:hypothetical protein